MDAHRPVTLADWLERQEQHATERLFGAISATHLIKERPGFGQVITPAPGAVLASPVDANWDPEPDYFFHWLRDGALAMEAARLQLASPQFGQLAGWELEHYVSFSRRLAALDGAARVAEAPLQSGVAPEFLHYVRDPDELGQVNGDAARGDVRFNPDGTLDITRWSRPQYDGVALRALGLLRCLERRNTPEWAGLITDDLDCVARNADRPCVDLWEEEEGFHCHTMLTQYAALRAGAAWGGVHARQWSAAADGLWRRLVRLRRPDDDGGGWIVSRQTDAGDTATAGAAGRLLDASVVLGVIHAGLAEGPFSVADPLAHGTLLRLEAYYAAAFPLNAQRSPGGDPGAPHLSAPQHLAPHLGRNPADVYFDGGAWPLITLAAAEMRFRLAATVMAGLAAPEVTPPQMWFGDAPGGDADDVARLLVQAGDAGLASVRAVTPDDGCMSEQVDRATGAPRSARDLTWSYAALLTALDARRNAMAAIGFRGEVD